MARSISGLLAQHFCRHAIVAYRLLLAPFFGGACRFVPSCSRYAEEAIERHGPWRGAALAAARLARCHPWGAHGYDPVPLVAPARRRASGAPAARAHHQSGPPR